MFTLRPYQKEALEKLLWSCKQSSFEGGDLVVLPTGAGKSLVIAELAVRLSSPILIIQPTREILEQNYEKLTHYVEPMQIGVYSASMDRKDLGFYTFATIGSVYKHPEKFAHFGVIIIDECHLVNPKRLKGMFMSFINKINKIREEM